jgi:phage terminase large subunit-like protein
MADRATAYALDVVNGRVLACRYVKLACARHLRDIDERRFIWDATRAERAINFFPLLSHYKGEGHAGKPFELSPWQCFIVGCVNGWRMRDGARRYRYAYVEVPRKNGKTTMVAGFGIQELLCEPGAEVYSLATKEDQAKIGWRDAANMIKASAPLRNRLSIRVKEIRFEARNGIWKPLGSDSDTLDGLNPSFACADELHQWRNRALWDVIDDGMGSRSNPLIFEITTAGHNQNGICWEHRGHVVSILEGADGYRDDRFFGIIYTVDDPLKWDDESEWRKANPNLGVSKTLQFMRDQADQARMMTTKLNAFLNKQLNIWTQQKHRWLSLEKWDACRKPVAESDLAEAVCYGGLDLASVSDLTALALYWPSLSYLRLYYWVPEETARERDNRDRVPYLTWQRDGWLTATPGAVTDYSYIRQAVSKLRAQYKIDSIAFDRYNSSQLVVELRGDGAKMEPFGQGFGSMSAPSKALEMGIAGGTLCHSEGPVTRWMIGNVSIESNATGDIKPVKTNSGEKIDGVVASVMAIGISLLAPPKRQVWIMSL